MAGEKAPWLEPGLESHALPGAATMSLAITFKRLVDMLEPFAKVAAEQLAEQAASERKGKGK